jgi:hypothetical protein
MSARLDSFHTLPQGNTAPAAVAAAAPSLFSMAFSGLHADFGGSLSMAN